MIPPRMRWPLAVIALFAMALAAGPGLQGVTGANLLGGLSRESGDKQIMFETLSGDGRVSTSASGNPEGVQTTDSGSPEAIIGAGIGG